MQGRIYFLGNPWPEGHAIKQFQWSAERRGADIWFGLHLETANYDEERDIEEEDDVDHPSSWQAPFVWGNYHSCTLSSNAWHDGGFPACPVDEYTVERIDKASFHVDPLSACLADDGGLNDDHDDRAFHIYLLGHDAVADHHIRFDRVAGTDLFNIVWEGRIALAYVGDYEPKYSFRAEIAGVPFPRID